MMPDAGEPCHAGGRRHGDAHFVFGGVAGVLVIQLAAQAPQSWLKARVLETKAGAGAVYDAARERLVVFGGDPAECDSCPQRTSDETWEWDGTAWTRREPVHRPSPRYGSAMA